MHLKNIGLLLTFVILYSFFVKMHATSLRPTYKVAIVGGGITGAIIFNKLSKLSYTVKVDLFDQGRSPGGRASTRFVPEVSGGVSFDHGAQFFRADTADMRELVVDWLKEGWVQEWAGPHTGAGDFFGLPSTEGAVYVGGSQGGICRVPIALIDDALQGNADRAR